MAASLTHALEQAPDAAVIAFSKERLALIQIDNKGSLKRCVAAFNGVGDFGLNAQEQLRFMHAIGNLYKTASVERKTSASEAERSAATELLTAIYQKKIDPNGVLGDEEKRKALSEAEQCDMFKRLMNEIHSRPVKEGAALIRIMLTG